MARLTSGVCLSGSLHRGTDSLTGALTLTWAEHLWPSLPISLLTEPVWLTGPWWFLSSHTTIEYFHHRVPSYTLHLMWDLKAFWVTWSRYATGAHWFPADSLFFSVCLCQNMFSLAMLYKEYCTTCTIYERMEQYILTVNLIHAKKRVSSLLRSRSKLLYTFWKYYQKLFEILESARLAYIIQYIHCKQIVNCPLACLWHKRACFGLACTPLTPDGNRLRDSRLTLRLVFLPSLPANLRWSRRPGRRAHPPPPSCFPGKCHFIVYAA